MDMPHSQYEGAVFLCQYVLESGKELATKGILN